MLADLGEPIPIRIMVEDCHLKTRPKTDALKTKSHVEPTLQIWLDGKRIGEYDALTERFHIANDRNATTYAPVIAIFAATARIRLVASVGIFLGTIGAVPVVFVV